MNWSTLAPLLASTAPLAGKILGGFIPFPGGAFIAEEFGKVIARKFGVPENPAAVAAAIQGSPNEVVIAKINAAQADARANIDGFVAYEQAVLKAIEESLRQTGETMRVEILPENRHWFYTGWRPACGWVFVVVAMAFGLMLTYAGFVAAFRGDDRAVVALNNAWPLFLAYFGPLALMVGVFIGSRSAEKAVEKKAVIEAAKSGVVVAPQVKPVKNK